MPAGDMRFAPALLDNPHLQAFRQGSLGGRGCWGGIASSCICCLNGLASLPAAVALLPAGRSRELPAVRAAV